MSNCTWPVYETLAVCSECVDISDKLTYGCTNGRLDWASDLPGGEFGIELRYPNGTMCGFFFNGTTGASHKMTGFAFDHNTSTPTEALILRTMPGLSVYERKPLFGNGTINFPQYRNPITDIIIVSSGDGTVASVYRKEPPVAHECVLAWCVQTIRSAYDEGAYHEDILATHINTTTADNLWVTFAVQTEYQNGTDITYTQKTSTSR